MRAYVLDLEQRLDRMTRAYEVRATHIKNEYCGVGPQETEENWAFVRSIEIRFSLMQSDYGLRISSMEGEVMRCTSRISNNLSCNSNGMTGAPLSTS
jgi:hypothetical protein